jgi:hypothetical protein
MTLLASQFRCEPEWQGEQCHDIPTMQMSALGQKQTFAVHKPMSALPPKADMCVSFDHFVSAGEYGRRHSEAKRLGRFQIEHQLGLGRRLHRKVGGLLALEDAVDILAACPNGATGSGP